jgi:DNA repair exonuclease SbcCD ATPase subunit
MRITRLYMQNYRVYEDPLDLEIPPGLVGIYGPNGSGKSVLLESILWTLWGRSRTDNSEVRTAGVKGECITECEFEHEGHLYVVRRTLKGGGKQLQPKAEAFADGQQVASGPTDTKRYVHSILGMDDAPFRASVFAEQKQLAAFSSRTPGERKKLVLKLLGITPLDGARDLARKDAKAANERFDQLRSVLPDLDPLRVAAEDLAAAADARDAEAMGAESAATAARDALENADRKFEEVNELGREFERIKVAGTAARQEVDDLKARLTTLEEERAALATAEARQAELAPLAAGLPAAETRLPLAEAVATAGAALAAVKIPEAPPVIDEDGLAAARVASEQAASELANVEGRLHGATLRLEAARAAVGRAHELSGEGDCPLCGQALGAAFEQVQAHRAAEVTAAEADVAALAAQRSQLAAAAKDARTHEQQLVAAIDKGRAARDAFARAVDQRTSAENALAEAEARLDPPLAAAEPDSLRRQVRELRTAAEELSRLSGRLERRDVVIAELEATQLRVQEAGGRLETLRDKAKALGFKPEQLEAARVTRIKTKAAAEVAAKAAYEVRLIAVQARGRAEAEAAKIVDAEAQHATLATLGDEARHLSRLGDLLHGFREGVVAKVGPMLEQEAGSLFNELTNHEYDDFKVDPETYEIMLGDAGFTYGMDRFSGSETDLANLALRIAISEQVRLQSGGAVGLLVLDEVFGPLDDDRKERMLLALERLKSRFRQVLVVTHDNDIKEQLPNAIEVIKLPGRRATARVVA